MRKPGKLGLLGAVGLGLASLVGCARLEKEIEFNEGVEGYQLYSETQRPKRGTMEGRIAFQKKGKEKELVVYDSNLNLEKARFKINEEGRGGDRKIKLTQTYPDPKGSKEKALLLAEKLKGKRTFVRKPENGNMRMLITDRDYVKAVYWLSDKDGRIVNRPWFLEKGYVDPTRLALVLTEVGEDAEGKPVQQILVTYDDDNDGKIHFPEEGSKSLLLDDNNRPYTKNAVIREEIARKIEAAILPNAEVARETDVRYHELKEREKRKKSEEEKKNEEEKRIRSVRKQEIDNLEQWLNARNEDLTPGLESTQRFALDLAKMGLTLDYFEKASRQGVNLHAYLMDPKHPEYFYRMILGKDGQQRIERVTATEVAKEAEKDADRFYTHTEKQLRKELEKAALERVDTILTTSNLEKEIKEFRTETEKKQKKIEEMQKVKNNLMKGLRILIPFEKTEGKPEKKGPLITPTTSVPAPKTPTTISPTTVPTTPVKPTTAPVPVVTTPDTKPKATSSVDTKENNWGPLITIGGSCGILAGLTALYILTRKRK